MFQWRNSAYLSYFEKIIAYHKAFYIILWPTLFSSIKVVRWANHKILVFYGANHGRTLVSDFRLRCTVRCKWKVKIHVLVARRSEVGAVNSVVWCGDVAKLADLSGFNKTRRGIAVLLLYSKRWRHLFKGAELLVYRITFKVGCLSRIAVEDIVIYYYSHFVHVSRARPFFKVPTTLWRHI